MYIFHLRILMVHCEFFFSFLAFSSTCHSYTNFLFGYLFFFYLVSLFHRNILTMHTANTHLVKQDA